MSENESGCNIAPTMVHIAKSKLELMLFTLSSNGVEIKTSLIRTIPK